MDSMRSLNSSLPSSGPSRAAPPDLLQAFRSAALSVTNLYKSAAADQANSRQAGYQEALEDLLKFLDAENLGVQDGEGWRIRQWATQKYDGGSYQQHSDIEDESDHDSQHQTSSDLSSRNESEATTNEQEHDIEVEQEHDDSKRLSRDPVFQFTGNTTADNSMQTDRSPSPEIVTQASSSSPPIRVEVVNRNNKAMNKSTNPRQSIRPNPRDFTFTTGTKRKLNFPDFFDLSNVPDRKEGTKKSRIT